MIVVADASPLILQAKIGSLDLLPRLYSQIHISGEVYSEIVVAGSGLPGAAQVANAGWIRRKEIQYPSDLSVAQTRFGLGVGEISTIVLAKEIGAQIVLIDDLKGRRLAKEEGFEVRGTVGILETLFRQREITDLRAAFQKLLVAEAYIAREVLNQRLELLGLPPL